jgi:prepilin-type N-terminal cleavage/methylation domain-containing protein
MRHLAASRTSPRHFTAPQALRTVPPLEHEAARCRFYNTLLVGGKIACDFPRDGDNKSMWRVAERAMVRLQTWQLLCQKVEENFMIRVQPFRRQGFTLVEMLVVISIIGILAGLITAGAMVAMHKARQTSITMELTQMDMALKSLRDQFGAYPPDGTDTTAQNDANRNGIPDDFERFFRRAFPRANLESELLVLKNTYRLNIKFSPPYYTPQTTMVFWLGGMPEDTYDTSVTNKNPLSRLIGFSKDPIHPLSGSPVNSPSRIGPFYEFQTSDLRLPPGPTAGQQFFRTYLPPVNTPTETPYVYLRAEPSQRGGEYIVSSTFNGSNPVLKSFGNAKAYWDARSKGFVNPSSCQILCAGLDGQFGSGNVFPSGFVPNPYPSPPLPLTPVLLFNNNNENLDDQTNFIKGVMKDEMP